MTFQYKVTQRRGVANKPASLQPEAEPEPEIGLIHGMVPDSREEWWIALALWRLKLEFYYQLPVRGGTQLRGGLVLDFLVLKPPLQIPMPFNGEWWHRNESEERWNMAVLQQEFGVEPVVIWGDEVPDVETTYEVVRSKLRV
jgi:hypothetical protein